MGKFAISVVALFITSMALGFVVQVVQQTAKLLHPGQVEQVDRPLGLVGDAFFFEQGQQAIGLFMAGVQHRDLAGRRFPRRWSYTRGGGRRVSWRRSRRVP